MALRVMKDGGANDNGPVSFAFRLCTGRLPRPRRGGKAVEILAGAYNHFENDTADAVKVSSSDLTNLPPDVNLHKVAAWAMVSRAILNLDETITKE